jgi:acyl-coenzyme A synthetase/AMP-(fatty) acid ligase
LADVATCDSDELGEPVPVEDDALAYLLRTSGSTGVPKLVGVTRASLDNYLDWVARELLTDDVALPVVSSPVFDASLKQTLGVVYRGSCVWILTGDRFDVAAVHAELAAATTAVALNCVPSYLSALLAEDAANGTGGRPPISRFLIGGEPLGEGLVHRIRQRFPDAEVWNLYGPTEATATTTAGRVAADEDIHVGTPVAGAAVAVIDEHGALVPAGVRGEVVIAGPGLSPGYLAGHDGPSPFVDLDLTGRRVPVYRTGDLGVLHHSGRLCLAGRRDSQVKLNGWRIDVREVERVSQRAHGVRDAVVVLDDRAEPCLRAFVTGDADDEVVMGELRAALPRPMVPRSVTVLAHFPVMATGKVDRAALLTQVTSPAEASPDEYDAEELAVATAWRQVVGRGWPRRDDEFFSVGGHSLLLARLVNLLRAQGNDHLSLRQVVRRPTVASIAALIRARHD